MLKDVWGSLTDMRQDMSDVKGQLEAGLVEMRAGFKNVCIHRMYHTHARAGVRGNDLCVCKKFRLRSDFCYLPPRVAAVKMHAESLIQRAGAQMPSRAHTHACTHRSPTDWTSRMQNKMRRYRNRMRRYRSWMRF